MVQKYLSIALLLLICSAFSAQSNSPIIPKPTLLQSNENVFSYSNGLDVKILRGNENTKRLQKELSDFLKGRDITIVPYSSTTISLNLLSNKDIDLPADGYKLIITPSSIAITSTGNAGLFYGVQSLKQLFYATLTQKLDCVEIKDTPAFSFRGMHLDVAHQFFTIDVVKKYLDAMAKLKLNQFHWQLSDGKNCKLKINSQPFLTDTTNFYTQEEIKSIVKYAQERFISIIPEIYIPAVSAQNPLSKNYQLIDELSALFPGEYVQIGNSITDDSTLAYWKQKGKKIIGNDKITTPNETIVSYKNSKSGFSLAAKGVEVIMATRQYCSLDYYQDWEDEKKSFNMQFLPLEKSYSFKPTGKIKDTTTLKHILGGQAFLYSNYIKNEGDLDYQAFPRLIALAECFWTKSDSKKFDDFESRLKLLKNYFYFEKELPKIDLVRFKPQKEQQ
ncbi:MAG: Beta-hexosaminidase [Bacteroidota bacterium]|jgi:hexosaminidase